MINADDVISHARSLIDTPFRHQGRMPGVALDCAGLGIVVAQKMGLLLEDFAGYPSTPFDGMLKKMLDCQPHLKPIDRHSAEPGDVLLMRIATDPQHIALMSYEGYMIHAYRQAGKVVEQRIDEMWKNKIVAAYRFVS